MAEFLGVVSEDNVFKGELVVDLRKFNENNVTTKVAISNSVFSSKRNNLKRPYSWRAILFLT